MRNPTTFDEWLVAWKNFLSKEGLPPSLEDLPAKDRQMALAEMTGWAARKGETLGFVHGLRKLQDDE